MSEGIKVTPCEEEVVTLTFRVENGFTPTQELIENLYVAANVEGLELLEIKLPQIEFDRYSINKHSGKSVEAKEVARLAIETLDTSEWHEFRDFFDMPMSNASTWNGNPCGFLSCHSDYKEKAVAALRESLLKVYCAQELLVEAFLAKPSVLAYNRPVGEGEEPDPGVTIVVDLSGSRPAKRSYIAFCFLHGCKRLNPHDAVPYGVPIEAARYAPLTSDVLKEYTDLACSEGSIGKQV